jgi:exonuclease III
MFHGITFEIINLYAPPNDLSTQSKLCKYINEHFSALKSKNRSHRTIIMGDFNAIMDPDLDKKDLIPATSKRKA